METTSKTNFLIRAETLEAEGSDPNICRNGQDQLFPLVAHCILFGMALSAIC